MSRIPYGPEEDEIIRRLWPINTAADVGSLIDRAPSSVDNRAQKLALRKAPAYIAATSTCFRQGQVPANKGLRRPGWSPGRMAETQFKPGVLQGRAADIEQPIGAERITKDGILQRKVNNDLPFQRRWKAVHAIVWEAGNGPIPAGHVVIFKPGHATTDASRIAADGLELVSRGELMRRNSYHNRYPKDVGLLIQLKGALNRKINRRLQEATP